MKVVVLLILGAVGWASRAWIERSIRSAFGKLRRANDVERARELSRVLGGLGLRVLAPGAIAWGPKLRIEYRVDGGLGTHVRISGIDPDVPRFALLADRDVGEHLPSAARHHALDLAMRRIFSGANAPFVSKRVEAVASAELRRLADRALANAEIIEHADGVLTAWIVAWFPEHATAQISALLDFARSLSCRPDLFVSAPPPCAHRPRSAVAGPYR